MIFLPPVGGRLAEKNRGGNMIFLPRAEGVRAGIPLAKPNLDETTSPIPEVQAPTLLSEERRLGSEEDSKGSARYFS